MLPPLSTLRAVVPPPEMLLPRLDYFRCSPSRVGGRAGHKEWQHFLVYSEHQHLLINFSLVDDPWATDRRRREVARLILLARGEDWEGGMLRFEDGEARVTPGHLDARFGDNTLRFEQGRYLISAKLQPQGLCVDLELTPITGPVLFRNRPLAYGESISWLLVPRLRARGTLTLGGRTERLEDTPAYHDHNWGHFRWGGDFAWEWASALPREAANPWSVVLVRMADRSRSRTRFQLLHLWRGAECVRTFQDHELRISHTGRFQPERFLQVPRVMALLAPGTANDLPERVEVRAQAGGDELHLCFTAEHLAQVVLPCEGELSGLTTINEICGRFTVQGRVLGEAVEMEGPGVFEFIRD